MRVLTVLGVVLGLVVLAPVAMGDDPVSRLIQRAAPAVPPAPAPAPGKAAKPQAPLPVGR